MSSIDPLSRAPSFQSRMMMVALAVAGLVATNRAEAQLQGFIEPFRRVDLSSDEAGSLELLNVSEGDAVQVGDEVARLDTRVQKIKVEIARQLAATESPWQAAQRTAEKRKSILDQLHRLKDRGHAAESEIIRATMELDIAEAKLLSAEEDRAVRNLELRRAEVELERRSIRSPFNGVIAKVHRREGEFLSPLHPEVATVVQLDRLFATFNIPSSQISVFQPGSEFVIKFANGRQVTAIVHLIGVEDDAKSGTVEVKLVFENPGLEIRSGESCELTI